jgi:single-strand DNA-binding protein
MNVVALVGNLGGDPESAFTNEGTQVVTFSLAFQVGEGQDFMDTGEMLEQNGGSSREIPPQRSAKIAVTGMLIQNKWTTDDGQNRSIHLDLRQFH